ncbi:hypothetical protein B6D52_02915 [Candidatus Parcubacteria bacterium 4484_255]|nr:MAG: hypothetical protein B6D52_02915 [Candidatus Parcubacteria bacterium 4484_255]
MAKIKQEKLKSKWYYLILVKFSGFIIFAFLIILSSINYFLFFRPKLAQTRNNGPLDIDYYQSILDEQRMYLNKLAKLKTRADKIDRREVKKLDYVLAQEAYIPSILNQINVLSEQSNLELTGLNLDFDNGVINLNLGFKGGTYQDIKKFIKQIETNIRIMDINELSFQNIGNTLNLKIQTYYLDNYGD